MKKEAHSGDGLHDDEVEGVEDRGKEGEVGLDVQGPEELILQQGASAGGPDERGEHDHGHSNNVHPLVAKPKAEKESCKKWKLLEKLR